MIQIIIMNKGPSRVNNGNAAVIGSVAVTSKLDKNKREIIVSSEDYPLIRKLRTSPCYYKASSTDVPQQTIGASKSSASVYISSSFSLFNAFSSSTAEKKAK